MKSKLLKKFNNKLQPNQVELQQKLTQVKNQIDEKTIEIEDMKFSAKSGKSVEVEVKGDKSIFQIKVLDEKLFEKDSREELIDLIVATANKAMDKVDEFTDEEISKITKDIPGLNF